MADLEYTLAVRAATGATLSIGSHGWGPEFTSTVPIYTTTLASTCAKSHTASSTTPSAQTSPTSTGCLDAIGLRDSPPAQCRHNKYSMCPDWTGRVSSYFADYHCSNEHRYTHRNHGILGLEYHYIRTKRSQRSCYIGCTNCVLFTS